MFFLDWGKLTYEKNSVKVKIGRNEKINKNLISQSEVLEMGELVGIWLID
jgi:hypothetical protein